MSGRAVVVIGGAVLDVSILGADAGAFARHSTAVKDIRISPGGDALNESSVLAQLGSSVSLVTLLGEDRTGVLLRQHCKELGIDLHLSATDETLSTSVNAVLVDGAGERCFLTVPGSSLRRLAPEHLERCVEALTGEELVSFASLFVSPCFTVPDLDRFFGRVKAKGCTLCADMTRCKNGERAEDLAPALRWVDVLFANREEAALLTGERAPESAAQCLRAQGAGTVVVKMGADGGFCASPEGNFFFPACPAERTVDTTGAGDTFAGAFLHTLAGGGSLRDCLRVAAAAASLCVERTGCDSSCLTEQALRRRMRTIDTQTMEVLP